MNAGEIALTRMPNGARSLAALLTRPITAAFVAEYTGMFGAPVTPAIEAVHTIAPPSPSDTHRFGHGREHGEHAEDVDVDDRARLAHRVAVDAIERSLDAGVVEQRPRRAELGSASLDERADRVGVGDVERRRPGRRADGAARRDGRLQLARGRRMIGRRDRPPALGELDRRGAADVAGRAGDQCDVRRHPATCAPVDRRRRQALPAGVEDVDRAVDADLDRFAGPPGERCRDLGHDRHGVAAVLNRDVDEHLRPEVLDDADLARDVADADG